MIAFSPIQNVTSASCVQNEYYKNKIEKNKNLTNKITHQNWHRWKENTFKFCCKIFFTCQNFLQITKKYYALKNCKCRIFLPHSQGFRTRMPSNRWSILSTVSRKVTNCLTPTSPVITDGKKKNWKNWNWITGMFFLICLQGLPYRFKNKLFWSWFIIIFFPWWFIVYSKRTQRMYKV